jgi:hypothetical protein
MSSSDENVGGVADDAGGRLLALEAAEAARGLLSRYADACDAADIHALAELFAPDAQFEGFGLTCDGKDAVLDFFRESWVADPTKKSHFVTNVRTNWLGDGVIAGDATFLFLGSGDDTSVVGWGNYRCRIRVQNRKALITYMFMSVTRIADVREGWPAATTA